jgi:hypothetical protein
MTRTERIALALMLSAIWIRMVLVQPLPGIEAVLVSFGFGLAAFLFVFGVWWRK